MYIDVLPTATLVPAPRIHVPYGIVEAASWLKYRANKKTFSIRPMDIRDVKILVNRHAARIAKQKADMDIDLCAATIANSASAAGGDVDALSTGGGNSNMNSPTQSQRKRQKGGGTPNTVNNNITAPTGTTPSLLGSPMVLVPRDRSNSNVSTGNNMQNQQIPLRIRGNSTSSESRNVTATSANKHSILGKNFTIELPMYMTVSQLIGRISDEIQVDIGHIALFVVHMAGRDWESTKIHVTPWSIAENGDMPISAALAKNDLSLKPMAKYCVFYRILPHNLLNAEGKDRRGQFKIANYLICDERLRSWRRLYLEHLKSDQNTSNNTGNISGNSSGSASDASVVTASGSNNNSGSKNVPPKRKEVSIVWPEPIYTTEYELVELNYVSTCTEQNMPSHQVAEILQTVIGIPTNIDELNALKISPSGVDASADIINHVLNHPLGADQILEDLCTAPAGVTTSLLAFVDNYATVASPAAGGATRDVVPVKLQPPYPLIITQIRENEVDCVTGANDEARLFVNSM